MENIKINRRLDENFEGEIKVDLTLSQWEIYCVANALKAAFENIKEDNNQRIEPLIWKAGIKLLKQLEPVAKKVEKEELKFLSLSDLDDEIKMAYKTYLESSKNIKPEKEID